MVGLRYDFDIGDITIGSDGSFTTAVTDNQNIALISLSQICRLTYPEVGAQIGPRILNRQARNVQGVLDEARRMAEADGAKNVSITIKDEELRFNGSYD